MKSFVKFSTKNKTAIFYIVSVMLLIIAAIMGILLGSSRINFSDITKSETVAHKIVMYVRLPRMVAGVLCGAALSVSGAVIQNVLANKIASPGIIGVNSGAAVMVTVCAAMGILGGWQLSFFAFLGALAASFAVNFGAGKFGASRSGVILMGVAVNSLLSAISDFIITLNPEAGLMSNDFKVGGFSAVTYEKLLPAAAIILVTIIILQTLSNELDILTLGDENAQGIGLSAKKMRCIFLILVSLLCGCSVAVSGMVSFVGLMVPHIIRKFSPYSTKHLLRLCALFGGAFVSICDTGARVFFSPYEVPVGIIMAIIGAPFFIFILLKRKGGHKND